MRGTAFAIAGVLVLAGCGESDPPLAPIDRTELHRFVDRARVAARAGDLAATHGALEALQGRVRALRAAGRVGEETAERLLKYSAVTQLRARAALAPAGPSAAGEAEEDDG